MLSKKNGKYERAINRYKKAFELNPKNKATLLGLFETYFTLGYYTHAFKAMNLYNYKKNPSRLQDINDISDKTILIQGEWNMNNMILFVI